MVLESPKSLPPEEQAAGDFSIVPLGTPLLAGPGPISSVIIFSSKGIDPQNVSALWASDAVLILLIAVSAFITYLSLKMALPVGRWLGATGINVLTRLAGILVAAIAIQMILGGLLKTFPSFK
jgi:multiple antibiotic resistance protein